MKILIIGNGFDVEHKLPTKYTDFLEFCEKFLANSEQKSDFPDDLHEEFSELRDNVWLAHLLERYHENRLLGDKWIDFEREVRLVIGILEDVHLVGPTYKERPQRNFFGSLTGQDSDTNWFQRFKNALQVKKSVLLEKSDKYAVALSEFMFEELMQFTRAFEIYCVCVVDKHVEDYAGRHGIVEACAEAAQLRSCLPSLQKDLEFKRSRHKTRLSSWDDGDKIKKDYLDAETAYDVAKMRIYELDTTNAALNLPLTKLDFDCVLSFNFTSTYETLYNSRNAKFCYIHGKAQPEKGKTDMIFGIDETLTKESGSDKHFTFAKFKKYFQRIVNETGSEYKDWIAEMLKLAAPNNKPYEVHIIGHSLDATDHEILKEFFAVAEGLNHDKAHIYIYYHDEIAKVRLIEKTIEMIGKDELIKRVHGNNKNISFINQYDSDKGIINAMADGI